jgi:hypothetical protein
MIDRRSSLPPNTGHIRRVAIAARRIAGKLRHEDRTIENLEAGRRRHDEAGLRASRRGRHDVVRAGEAAVQSLPARHRRSARRPGHRSQKCDAAGHQADGVPGGGVPAGAASKVRLELLCPASVLSMAEVCRLSWLIERTAPAKA